MSNQNQSTNYGIFFTGVASTPNTVGLINWSNMEKIHEISCARPTGKETRKMYEKYSKILQSKYKHILN